MEHASSALTQLVNGALDAHLPDEIVMATLVALILLTVALLGGRRLSLDQPRTFQQVLEVAVGGFAGMLDSMIPHHGRRHVMILGGFGAFILVGNLFGLIPGLAPPTSSYNLTLACALISFFYYNGVALKAVGAGGVARHLMGPVLLMAPLLFPIELVSQFARILSLSMRLFGNIYGEHVASGVFQGFFGGWLVPLPMMFLGLFASFLQAFIFTLLSMIYISLATEH